MAHRRIRPGGWSRQITVQDFPQVLAKNWGVPESAVNPVYDQPPDGP